MCLWNSRASTFCLPRSAYPYAPVGQTPIVHEHLSRDHLSVISAISVEGKLLMMEQERSFKSQAVGSAS